MLAYCIVLLLLLGGAAGSLACGNSDRALSVASLSVLSASLVGFAASVYLLVAGQSVSLTLPLALPLGECAFLADEISLFFLVPVFFLSGASALVLPARMRLLQQEAPLAVRYGRHGFFYCMLVFGMVLVLMAADAVFFVISWEIMSLAPFFLISPADRDSKERAAIWIYLVAAHLGALVLLYLFAELSVGASSTSFAHIAASMAAGAGPAPGLILVLALVGFGVKAGFVPLHVWMPEAYSAAPGHVAVLLCGAMLNLGLYGILRVIMLLGAPQEWWAYAIMGIGAFSGIIGILLALAQADIKRTLAYSSTENIGVICLALGGGMLAGLHNAPEAMYLLFAGALLHIWNHSIFKSLLFMAANALRESTHDTRIHVLGGLQRRLPFTGAAFAAGSAAIAGVPPLNGFMSEMLMYVGFATAALAQQGHEVALVFWGAFFVLGAIAGMAVFTFTRTYGLAFLGEGRSRRVLEAREPEKCLLRVMLVFALLCFAMPLAGPGLLLAIQPGVGSLAAFADPGGLLGFADRAGTTSLHILCWYAAGCLLLYVLWGGCMLLRRRWLAVNGSSPGLTWDCGYPVPSPRIQYSAASFSNTLTGMLHVLVRRRVSAPEIQDIFPARTELRVETPDWASQLWDKWTFQPVLWLAEAAKGLQAGLVNVYVLYVFIALVAALVYALGGAS